VESGQLRDAVLRHEPRPPYAYPLADERIRVRLRTALDDGRRPVVEWSDRMYWTGANHEAPMRWLCDDDCARYWEASIVPREGRVRYIFRLDAAAARETTVWFGEAGTSAERPAAIWPDGYFHWPYLHRRRLLDTPAWVRDAICYEIFPDRFARGTSPVAPELQDVWPGRPTPKAFWGGDLRGVLERVDHVASLGVNLMWLTPIFEAPSNHKYDTTDYGRIDPHFGDDEIFARVVAEYRRRGIGIVLDGVYNHSGTLFGPWQDVVHNGVASPYWGWFDVQEERPDPQARNYRSFDQVGTMPRLMTDNPEVQAYLIERAQRWTRMGIAGWRLDVADEVAMDFWRRFRREMRAINPEAYFVGEVAYNAVRWLEGDQFDGVMNYPLRAALLRFIAEPSGNPGAPKAGERLDAGGLVAELARIRSWHPGWATTAALNAISTHDVPRFLTACNGEADRWRLGMAALMTLEGIPLIYYGDEVGLEGGYDPDCRRPMPWDPSGQRAEMLAATRQLTRLRRDLPALRASGLRPLASGSPDVAAYLRGTSGMEEVAPERCPPGAVALVVLNRADTPRAVTLDLSADPVRGAPTWPATGRAIDLLAGKVHQLDGARLRLEVQACSAMVLVPES
jgi:cyclomaltodextrinase / maltogenic alpha-amylase / neopullulanase